MNHLRMPMAAALSLLLGACAVVPESAVSPDVDPAPKETIPAGIDPFLPTDGALTRGDAQGAIMVEVTPRNLGDTAEAIEFDVALNTHSVDLTMDLAALSTLSTDAGFLVRASNWDAPRGGHHVSGTLIFPAAQGGARVLEGATKITLTIENLGAPTRIFEWELE